MAYVLSPLISFQSNADRAAALIFVIIHDVRIALELLIAAVANIELRTYLLYQGHASVGARQL
jgi:hypothetical protein